MLGMMPGTRRAGGQRRQSLDDVKDWTRMALLDLVHVAEKRNGFREFIDLHTESDDTYR